MQTESEREKHVYATGAPGDLRALMVLDHVPARHQAMAVVDDRNAPHLRSGEFAVVDPVDRVPQHGELFAVRYSRGPAIMQAMWMHWLGEANWWCRCLDRPRGAAGIPAWAREGRTIPSSDGPYAPGGLESLIIGRIVGVLVPLGQGAR